MPSFVALPEYVDGHCEEPGVRTNLLLLPRTSLRHLSLDIERLCAELGRLRLAEPDRRLHG